MRIKLAFLALMLAIAANLHAAGTDFYFRIYIADSAYFPTVSGGDSDVTVTFSDSGLNAIIANYHIDRFSRDYMASRHQFMKNYWTVGCNSASLMSDLMSYLPNVFLDGEALESTILMSYPNDYGKAYGGKQDDLDLINARTAWGIDTGNSSVIIGVVDTWLDMHNADIPSQVVEIRRNQDVKSKPNHGTAVVGCAAGATNNDTLLAGVCPGCRIDFCSEITGPGDDENVLLQMSADGDRVVNASWGLCFLVPTISDIVAYDEMYENNTVVAAAAGDGAVVDPSCGTNSGLLYPASESHNFSVTAVGDDSTSTNFNMRYIHNMYVNDSNSSYQHNARVDISAPGYWLPLLISGSLNGGVWTEQQQGTSFSSPIVAGACGLVASHNSAYSAYQIKYLIKATANPIIYTKAPNFPYIGKLGTGVLDVGNALSSMGNPIYDPNSSALQTMNIAGVELNTICAPGYSSNNAKPKLKAIVNDGTPPFTYTWYPLPENNTLLSDTTSDDPIIDSAWGNFTADYYLIVTDASGTEQKRASRHIHIKLDTAQVWDLAGRDSYLDMLDEPNSQSTVDSREWHVWESPDVWNRLTNDGQTVHQQPQYYSHTTPNYCYTRVRNVGCIDAPAHEKVHLYWTKASTGENWPNDWDTSEKYNGITAGGEITDTSGIDIAQSIAPGDDTIISSPWFPPRPQDYDSTEAEVEVCFLTRIDPPTITFPEVPHITTNVVNNNNIVTRNMVDYNLGGLPRFGHITFANAENATHIFNLNLATDKHFHPEFGGDISEYFSSIDVTISPTMYSSWAAHGYHGNYNKRDDASHTITFSHVSDFMSIQGISLTAHEEEGVTIKFNGQPGIDTMNFAPRNINVIQELVTGEGTSIYGDVTYYFHSSSGGEGKRQANTQVMQTLQPASKFGIYPNPTSGTFTLITAAYRGKASVIINDIVGREVKKFSYDFSNSDRVQIDLTGYANGLYTVQVLGQKGIRDVLKIVKE